MCMVINGLHLYILISSLVGIYQAVLWNMDTLKLKSSLEEHSLLITDVRFSPNSTRLATSSFDKTVRVWDADNVSHNCTFSRSLLYSCLVTFCCWFLVFIEDLRVCLCNCLCQTFQILSPLIFTSGVLHMDAKSSLGKPNFLMFSVDTCSQITPCGHLLAIKHLSCP